MDRKALRAGVERVFSEQAEVQRCQIHKRRNVREYQPENCQKDYDQRMRNAYAMNSYAGAKEGLQKIFRQLERIGPLQDSWKQRKKFPRIKGYQGILLLKERLNPSRIQQKEVRTVEGA
jgi:transposase-like protein